MKKLMLGAIGSFGCLGSVFAEGTAIVNTTAVNAAMTQIQTDLASWVTSALPIVLAIAGGFLAFWLGKMILRIIKSFSSAAK